MSQLLFIQGNSKTVTEGKHWDSDQDQDMEKIDSIAAALQHTDVSNVELYNNVWKSQTPPSGSCESLDPDHLTSRHPPYLHYPNSVCILWLHQSKTLNLLCFYWPAQKRALSSITQTTTVKQNYWKGKYNTLLKQHISLKSELKQIKATFEEQLSTGGWDWGFSEKRDGTIGEREHFMSTGA